MKFMYAAAVLAAYVSAVSVETGSQLTAEREMFTFVGPNSGMKPIAATCTFNKALDGTHKKARGPFRIEGH